GEAGLARVRAHRRGEVLGRDAELGGEVGTQLAELVASAVGDGGEQHGGDGPLRRQRHRGGSIGGAGGVKSTRGGAVMAPPRGERLGRPVQWAVAVGVWPPGAGAVAVSARLGKGG